MFSSREQIIPLLNPMSITTVSVQYFIIVHEIISWAMWDGCYDPSFIPRKLRFGRQCLVQTLLNWKQNWSWNWVLFILNPLLLAYRNVPKPKPQDFSMCTLYPSPNFISGGLTPPFSSWIGSSYLFKSVFRCILSKSLITLLFLPQNISSLAGSFFL